MTIPKKKNCNHSLKERPGYPPKRQPIHQSEGGGNHIYTDSLRKTAEQVHVLHRLA